ncbi:FG-GAP-like repeat-containing protein [Flavobacterium sp. LS1R47]|uniref:FG-GAP-like repeat-containing protein n=1 Tax=Flavobacterium frigoritolerans TaxID=2987686 RepID=A0A9X2ZLQ0_9FLAO|nr:RHS repeat-associated core domain-containing protein [Flavobacterium frigoritolerans]MCV9930947.1 FG-GAP-like repeat-containing protein [Flavobacterium frigoritolerans]
MKQFYYTLLFISLSFFVSAQDSGGTPVQGLTPIKRVSSTAETTNNNLPVNETAKSSAVSTLSAPTGSSTEVGITEGELAVSLSGSASYSIPIAVPPGINGVVPQISLVYNSQGGNGIAGYGWNISGISAITRIPRTKFHDGSMGGVNLDANDRFALDGQRLILKSGTPYGAPNTTYETENFSNIKITAIGTSPIPGNYGPASFLVEYPDGSIAEYGSTTDSQSITTWSITYWQNPQGVRIVYNYTNTNNNITIANIKYGALRNATPINEIQFVYGTRKRPEQSYVGGKGIFNDRILEKIEVKGNGIGFRNYNLTHNPTSIGYQRLEKITEFNGDGTKGYNPTVFSYETTAESISYNDITTKISVGNVSSQNAATVSGDFSGDERMEFLLYPTVGPDAKSKYWIYSDIHSSDDTNIGYVHDVGAFETIFPVSWLTWNNTLWSKQGWAVAKKTNTNYTFNIYSIGPTASVYHQYEKTANFPTVPVRETTNCKNSVSQKIFPKKILSGDFNGDGLTDVIAIDMELTESYLTFGCVSKTNIITSKKVYFIDLKRDKTTDFLTYSGELASNITSSSKVEVADINGDGKSDIIIFENRKATVYTLNDDYQLTLLFDYTDAKITPNSNFPLLGDYNGDGKTDFMIPYDINKATMSWIVYTSTGTDFVKSFFNRVWYNLSYEDVTYNYIATDYNKDGKSDLIIAKSNRNTVSQNGQIELECFNNQDGIFSYPVTNKSTIYHPDINVGTMPIYLPSGRGVATSGKPYNPTLEIAFLSNNKIFYFNSQKDNTKDQLLRTITTGNGVKESITYQPLSPNSYNENHYEPIYTSGYGQNYPKTDIESAATVQVVTKLERQSASVYKKQLFAYAGATSNLEGLGFMGYSASMRTNWFENDDQIISTISKFDPNMRGANTENYTYLGLVSPAIAMSNTAPSTPRASQIIVDNTRTATETLLATNSIVFRPGAIIAPTAGNTFIARITPDYDPNGYTETNTSPPYNLISKSLSFYETSLSPSKVFKLQNIQSKNYDILSNIGSETNTIYDEFSNPTESITKVKSGGVNQQTTTTVLAYESALQSPYIVGRPKNKTQTITAAGDSMDSKETYQYGSGSESNLLKTIQKWGNNTSAITETNSYDLFGNITAKTISAPGVTDRKTSFLYDPTGRFLKESTDIEGFKTELVYNPNGTLKSESKQTELGTWSNALVTGYEYDSWFKKTIVTDYLGKTQTYAYVRQNEKTKITLTGNTDDSYSEELFDELGRKIRTGTKDIQGTMSYKDFVYDIYDRNFSISEPNTGNPLWNTTTYDVYGRPESATDFKGKVITLKYDKLTSVATDGSTGQTKTTIKNAMGNVISMIEAPIGGTINYSYFANGNLKETNYNGNKISITQDGWGRKISLTDPSAGTYTYAYNELGENIKETTPNGETTFTLNSWGKPETKTVVGNNTNSSTQYIYTADSKLLLKTIYTDTGDAGKTSTTDYTYDSKKRLETTTETTGYGAIFTKKIEYDAWGRVDKETNTATLNGKSSITSTQNEYKNGFAYKIYEIKNGQKTKTLWETTGVNARGQLTQATLGNGIAINNTYDSYGYVTNMKHTLGTTTTMELGTNFDTQRGNLHWRKNSLFGNATENFRYDSQDRLTAYPNAEGIEENQTYEEDGRIKSNTVGVYNYANAGKKYQNTSITLTPEALSDYQTKPSQSVSYNTFKSPVEIVEEGKDKISFVYNDNNNRSVMFYGGLGLKQTRTYRKHYSADGTMEIKENTQTGALEFVTYVGGDGYAAPVVYKKTYNSVGATQEQTLYLHRDYQGSILAITDETGTLLEKRQFDAWGAIIKVQDGTGNTLTGLTILDRGYTGHEHLQSVGLIHMNGRLYDPKLHRFLQPDNYVQDPGNTQNYNRYGYVLNNPLKYIDPSGELSLKSIGRWIGKNANDVIAGVAIAVGVVLVAAGIVTFGTTGVLGGALIGLGVSHFAATYEEYKKTGDWNAASKNAGIFFGISFSTDFGYNNSKDSASGIIQNEPVVKPIALDDNKSPMSNWELSDKAFGKTNEIGTSFAILVGALQAAKTAAPYMTTIGTKVGNIATLSQVANNSVKYYRGEENGGISLQLYSYRMIGTGVSWGVGSTISAWGIGGSYAGPYGVLAAVGLGVIFQGVEDGYNTIAPQIQESFNHTFNALNRGNFVR